MADVILTKIQLEDLFLKITYTILGYTNLTCKGNVRLGYVPTGAPAFDVNTDVTFVNVLDTPQSISNTKDITHTVVGGALERKAQYHKQHTVKWTAYGPNAYANIDKIQSRLNLPEYDRTFKKSNLAMILNYNSPTRSPEPFQGQWWERWDMNIDFYELITRTDTVQYLVDAPVITGEG